MKVSVVVVMSLNGKITRGSGGSVMSWASQADGAFFKQILAENSVHIMGNRTYQSAKLKPNSTKLRVLLTRQPDAHFDAAIPGEIEYTAARPTAIINDLQNRGYDSALVLGGSEIYSLFIGSGLVTDLYITVEPVIFNSGVDLVSNLAANVSCTLVSSEILNEQGSLLLHYTLNPKVIEQL